MAAQGNHGGEGACIRAPPLPAPAPAPLDQAPGAHLEVRLAFRSQRRLLLRHRLALVALQRLAARHKPLLALEGARRQGVG